MRRFLLAGAAAAAFAVRLAAQAAAPAAAPTVWTVDTRHTSAAFSVKHLMLSTVRGTLGPVTGTIEYDGRSVDGLKADIAIDVGGINTGNESRDRDLKTAEGLFEIARFPTATFKSTRAVADGRGGFKLTGDLTIHGVTREVTLNVEGPSAPLRQGATLRVGAAATGVINRRDFGLSYSRVVEAAPVVSDEVRIVIDVEATRPIQ